jgi:hypothetical protein
MQVSCIIKINCNALNLQVKSPTSELLKIEQQISPFSNGQKSIKEEVFVLGLQPLEINRVINFPYGSKHTVFKKSKYNLNICGSVVSHAL